MGRAAIANRLLVGSATSALAIDPAAGQGFFKM